MWKEELGEVVVFVRFCDSRIDLSFYVEKSNTEDEMSRNEKKLSNIVISTIGNNFHLKRDETIFDFLFGFSVNF